MTKQLFPNYQDIAADIFADNGWSETPTKTGRSDDRSFLKNGYLAVLGPENTIVYQDETKSGVIINSKHPKIMENPIYSFVVHTVKP